jgi:hypothetical protein
VVLILFLDMLPARGGLPIRYPPAETAMSAGGGFLQATFSRYPNPPSLKRCHQFCGVECFPPSVSGFD